MLSGEAMIYYYEQKAEGQELNVSLHVVFRRKRKMTRQPIPRQRVARLLSF
jgi:hypothetical protein